MKTLEEIRALQRAKSARWLAKPGNREKHRQSVKICGQRPHAKEAHRNLSRFRASTMREEERIRVAKWRKNHPEKAALSHRKYYLNNTALVRAATKSYRLKNKAAYLLYGRQYKAAKRAGGGRLSRGYVASLLLKQDNLCVACKCDLVVTGYHLDHIHPIAKGGKHCDSNVQLLCPTCNHRKSDKNFQNFLRMLELDVDERSRYKPTQARV